MSWVILEEDGRPQRVAVVRDAGGAWVGWSGGSAYVARASKMAGRAERAGGVIAPLTGKVIQIDIAVGDDVEADALLVVLEAMKMEYRLTAPRAGTVAAIRCAVGELVDQGATLVDLGS